MRVAVLSFAHPHAASYVSALRARADVDLVAADPEHGLRPAGESGGRQLADQLGIRYVEDYSVVWDWHPDAVLVCSENARHRDLVIQAAAAGAHVLCEKPLATSITDAEAMIEACDRAGVHMMIAHPVRYSAAYAELKEACAAGRIGRLIGVTGTNNGKLPADRQWFTDPGLAGGGSLTDHTTHVADLLDDLLAGDPAVSVYASTNAILHGDQAATETGGLVSIEYASGVIASIDCSWSKPDSYPTWGGLTLNVVGDAGIADMDAFSSRLDGHSERTGSRFWIPYGDNADAAMIDEFIDGIAAGRGPQPTGESGLRTVQIVQAAYESVRRGRAIVPERNARRKGAPSNPRHWAGSANPNW
jgi:predicted dehydrogenase